MIAQDWIWGFAGGILMGLGCTGLMLFNGRILGVSGLLGGALKFDADSKWRWAFIVGMLVAGVAALAFVPAPFHATINRTLGATLVGGILVGAGTQLGSGCTSGHGICGIGRLSPRSLVATMTFMAGGAVAVLIIRTVFGGAL